MLIDRVNVKCNYCGHVYKPSRSSLFLSLVLNTKIRKRSCAGKPPANQSNLPAVRSVGQRTRRAPILFFTKMLSQHGFRSQADFKTFFLQLLHHTVKRKIYFSTFYPPPPFFSNCTCIVCGSASQTPFFVRIAVDSLETRLRSRF